MGRPTTSASSSSSSTTSGPVRGWPSPAALTRPPPRRKDGCCEDLDGTTMISPVQSVSRYGALVLKLSPVPATDRLSVSLPGAGQALITIFNSNGQPVFHSTYSGTEKVLDISSLSAGQYVLVIRKGKSMTSAGFVKQ